MLGESPRSFSIHWGNMDEGQLAWLGLATVVRLTKAVDHMVHLLGVPLCKSDVPAKMGWLNNVCANLTNVSTQMSVYCTLEASSIGHLLLFVQPLALWSKLACVLPRVLKGVVVNLILSSSSSLLLSPHWFLHSSACMALVKEHHLDLKQATDKYFHLWRTTTSRDLQPTNKNKSTTRKDTKV